MEEEAEPALLEVIGGEPKVEYSPPEEPVFRTQAWVLGNDGDHSCTQFAVLGLWSAERGGIEIDDEVWRRVLTHMARHQILDDKPDPFGGFGYSGRGTPYGSMTGAGLCVLAIAGNRLFDDLTPREHLRVRNALGWLVRNFSVSENPNKKRYNYYCLYSLERVGRIIGVDFIGNHEWYPLGAKYLVDAQNEDESWPTGPGEGEALLTSSYALLFLTRATPELDAEPEPEPTGPGTLVTEVKRPEVENRVYLILDASGSMRSEIGGVSKLDIARAAVMDMVKTLLVLLTDGGEDSRDTDPVAAAAAFAGREDVELFILGFDINRADWSRQLKAMAEAGNGVCRPVNDASALARDLRAVVFPPVPEFHVRDWRGSEVAAALFGGGGDHVAEGRLHPSLHKPRFQHGFPYPRRGNHPDHFGHGASAGSIGDYGGFPRGGGEHIFRASVHGIVTEILHRVRKQPEVRREVLHPLWCESLPLTST